MKLFGKWELLPSVLQAVRASIEWAEESFFQSPFLPLLLSFPSFHFLSFPVRLLVVPSLLSAVVFVLHCLTLSVMVHKGMSSSYRLVDCIGL